MDVIRAKIQRNSANGLDTFNYLRLLLADTATSSRSKPHLVNRRLPEETGPSAQVVAYNSRPTAEFRSWCSQDKLDKKGRANSDSALFSAFIPVCYVVQIHSAGNDAPTMKSFMVSKRL